MSFIANMLDRQSIRRKDIPFLNERLARPDCEVILSTAYRLVFDAKSRGKLGHPRERARHFGLDRQDLIFLGQNSDGSRPLFAGLIGLSDEEVDADDSLWANDLRNLALQGVFGGLELGVLAQARAMLHWHRTHRFCSRCGKPTQMADAGYRRECPSCGAQHFPRTDPCVIMLITDGDRALLGRPPRLPPGIYTTLAGFMEPGETIEQAVRRETQEESRIEVGEVHLVANQPWPFPSNLMLGCIGRATSSEIFIDDDELEACGWFTRDEVRQMVKGTHPDGYRIPPSISIAYDLITGWLEGTISA
ncbi:NAD(+) diphosphatase [Roseibium sp. RKSG952]|nr:NAD(+) diphosphatase [Roseibium sp. RKSG952]